MDVSGWGIAEYRFPDVPNEADLNYITNEACTKKPSRWKDKNMTDSMMCADALEKHSCFGDSGGPCVRQRLK